MAVAEIINRAWFRYYRGFAVTSFTGPAIELQVVLFSCVFIMEGECSSRFSAYYGTLPETAKIGMPRNRSGSTE